MTAARIPLLLAPLVFLLLLPPTPANADIENIDTENTEARNNAARPKVGLVLGGGGARGGAHVGVLKILERMRIPIDYVAGTSMGAIVGGLYASGMSIDEMDVIISETDWNEFYSDRRPRAEHSFRRKSDENGFLVNFDMGLKRGRVVFPIGLVQGQKFEMALRRWLLPVATVKDFDRLPVPFRAVATDIVSGDMVVLKSGDLASAIRASMSAPGALKPVKLNGRVLVDGGISNNLPVQIVKGMGADVLIVVDVGFPLLQEEELVSALGVTSQMLNILIKANSKSQIELMAADDILIKPELGRLRATDFERLPEAMAVGEESAQQALVELSRLSLSRKDYLAHRANLAQRQSGVLLIDRLRIENQSLLSPKVMASRLSDHAGKTLNVELLESEIEEIYGFDTFESVTYALNPVDSKTELVLTGKEKSWGPTYLRFGFNVEDDFKGTGSYNIAARLTKTEINRLGGELRVEAVIGTNSRLFAEFYQPLDYKSRWFLNPAVELSQNNNTLFDSGHPVAQLRNEGTFVTLAVGRQFSNWGEARLTYGQINNDASIRIGDPSLPRSDSEISGPILAFSYDTIDDVSIPRFGAFTQVQWLASRERFGSDLDFDSTELLMIKPHTWGKNTLLHWWNVASVTKGEVAPYSLGGLFNLSGYARGEISGKHLGIGRLLYYRRLGPSKLPVFDTPIYVGASIETGNVWQDSSDISFDNTRTAGALFVVLDTIIGPIYLAYGAADGGDESAYLFIGQTF